MFHKSSELAALSAANKTNGKSSWRVIWQEEHDDAAVVVLAKEDAEPSKQVICERAGDFWRAANIGDLFQFLPYKQNSKLGVETYFWKIKSNASSACLKIDFEEMELDIVESRYVFHTFWNLKGHQFSRWWTSPYPDFELWVDFERVWRYHDTSILDSLIEAREFCHAHYRHFRQQSKDDAWASDVHYGLNLDHEELFRMILMLIVSVNDPISDADYLLYVGKTHISDLFGPWLLNKLESMDNPDQRLLMALAGVDIDFEPLDLRQRAARILGQFSGLAKLSQQELETRLHQILDEKHARNRRDKTVRIGSPRVV